MESKPKDKFINKLKYFGYLLTGLSIYFLLNILRTNIRDIQNILFSLPIVFAIPISIILFCFTFLIAVYIWYILLIEKYPDFQFRQAFQIMGTTQIAKYLPSNIGHFVGKALVANKYLLNTQDVLSSILTENILLVYSCFIISLGYFLYFDIDVMPAGVNQKVVFTLVFLAVIILSLLFYYITKKKLIATLKYRTVLKIFVANCITFLVHGLIIYCLINLLFENQNINYLKCFFGVTVSFFLGFIVPGSPGGMGVREFVFVKIFSSILDNGYSFSLAILYRVVTILGDLLIFLISFIVLNFYPSKV